MSMLDATTLFAPGDKADVISNDLNVFLVTLCFLGVSMRMFYILFIIENYQRNNFKYNVLI